MAIPAGVPALILLLALFSFTQTDIWLQKICLPALHCITSDQYDTCSQAIDLLTLIVQITPIASIFWVWALYNTITSGFDLGSVSFGLCLLASARAALVASNRETNAAHLQYYLPGSCAFVVFNYAAGAVALGDTTAEHTIIANDGSGRNTLQYYYIVGAGFWIWAAYRSYTMATYVQWYMQQVQLTLSSIDYSLGMNLA